MIRIPTHRGMLYNRFMDIYITTLHEFEDLPGADLLSAHRAKQLQGSSEANAQARCLAAGLLQRHVFGDPVCGRIEKDGHGKPFVEGGPYFSVAGGGDIVALAVSDYGDIGVDVEEIGPFAQSLAENHLLDDEREWLESRRNKELAFSCLWTGKQSVIKAVGHPRRMPASSFSVLPVDRSWRILGQSSWFLRWRRIDGHMLCVTSMRPEKLTLQRLGREELTS